MRHVLASYQSDACRSPIVELLDMIANKSPHFMRCGDCGSGSEGERVDGLPKEARERIERLSAEGRTQREISAITGHSTKTVCKYVRLSR